MKPENHSVSFLTWCGYILEKFKSSEFENKMLTFSLCLFLPAGPVG